MKPEDVKYLAQIYMASKWWQNQNLNPCPFHCKSTLRSVICRRGCCSANVVAWKNVVGLRIWENTELNKPKQQCQTNNKNNHHQHHLLATCQTLCYTLTSGICNTCQMGITTLISPNRKLREFKQLAQGHKVSEYRAGSGNQVCLTSQQTEFRAQTSGPHKGKRQIVDILRWS